MDQDGTLNRVRDLAANNDTIDVVWLYGSRARSLEHDDSDYDLAIAFNVFIKDEVENRLRPEILALEWQSKLGFPVSIVDINGAPIPLAFAIISDESPIYVANDMRLIQEEQRIMSRWEIDYEFANKQRS